MPMTECQRGPDSPCAISKPLSSICPEPMISRFHVAVGKDIGLFIMRLWQHGANRNKLFLQSVRLGRTLKCASARDECRRTEPLHLCLWVGKDRPLKAQADSELQHP